MNTYRYRIAQAHDIESVFEFECYKRFQGRVDAIENQVQIWDSSFRKESLEHYFKLGWSFIALNEAEQVVGFFLAQPFLFVDKQTQTLWIELVSADSIQVKTELIDIAYRLSREKHFQKVILPEEIQHEELLKSFPFIKWDRENVILKTTK